MKKSTRIVLSLLIILFTVSIIPKDNSIQNDTFFDITIGNYIIENGIDMMDHWTWHTDLTYTYSHWLYSIIISLVYNLFSYCGIYIFVLIIASIITVLIFNLLIENGHKTGTTFIMTIFTAIFCRYAFVARAQIVTYILFILEYYFIEKLVNTNKKRYIPILFLISLIIANVHASLWILTIVFYLPYIVEFITYKILKKTNKYNKDSQIEIKNRPIKLLLIALIVSSMAGIFTPLGDVPYTFMYKNISGLSSEYIAELKPLQLIGYPLLVFYITCFVGLIFTKTKYKLVDILFFIGFFAMTLSALRSYFYLGFIMAFIMANLIDNFIDKYNIRFEIKNISKINKIKIKSTGVVIFLAIIIFNYTGNIAKYYFSETEYPINICQYILNNVDIENMKIFNQFNYGSYLEFCGIPAFMDSRSEVYCEEFNDTTILQDVADCEGRKNNI